MAQSSASQTISTSSTMPARTLNAAAFVPSENNLSSYLQSIRKFPVLTLEEEQSLANKWVEQGDVKAAHQLVTSHLRLVAKIAMGYRGYGLPLTELISEGNIGMMQAVKRFEPAKGFRLSTYAMWWIRAAIQEYILQSWSLVKMGTTAAQKKLFFNLKKLKKKMENYTNGDLSPEQVTYIAQELDVPEDDVVQMNRRLGSPIYSLNAPINDDGEGGQWQDWLADDRDNQETTTVRNDELNKRQAMLAEAMQNLNQREKDIIAARRLSEEPLTLEELSERYKISRERVRQIEARAFEKLQQAIQKILGTKVEALPMNFGV